MKNLFQIIAAILLSSVATAQWGYVNPPETFYGGNYVIDHNSELYHANNEDIHKTSDEGNNWTNLTQGFVNAPGNANLIIQFAGDNIFVGSTLLGVFMSPDNGSTWQVDTTGLEGSFNNHIVYTDGTNIYSSFDWPTYGFYMKPAAPGAWTRINSNLIGSGYGYHVKGMTKINNTLYAATQGHGIYESIDDGVTWTQKSNAGLISPVDGQFANRLLNIGPNLFVSTDNGIYKSTDQAESWTRVDQGFAVWDQFNVVQIWAMYTDGSNLYASVAQDDSAYVSTDGGNSWSDISDGLRHRIKSFAVHNGKLYAAQWDTDSSVIRRDIPVGIDDEKTIKPHKFNLSQNYPNPFNPSTTIQYDISKASQVNLVVYDILGQKIGELVKGFHEAGSYSVNFDASKFPSGLYIYRLQAGKFTSIKKMILLK